MTVKQVIVMRKDLGMRKGKMIAQGAHASMAFLTSRLIHEPDDILPRFYGTALTEEEEAWIKDKFTKICVSVGSEDELLILYNEAIKANLTVNLIQDAGLTEFDGIPTYTCLALGPHEAELIDPITGHLPLL